MEEVNLPFKEYFTEKQVYKPINYERDRYLRR